MEVGAPSPSPLLRARMRDGAALPCAALQPQALYGFLCYNSYFGGLQGSFLRPLRAPPLPGSAGGVPTPVAGRRRSHQRSGMEWSMDDFTSPADSLGAGEVLSGEPPGPHGGNPGAFFWGGNKGQGVRAPPRSHRLTMCS